MDKNFFLIGFMASGKSSMGKKLAAHFGYEFIDLDELVASKAGKSIAAIFKEDGEDTFRKLESEALRNLPKGNHFIATGGGTACHSDNMKWMKKNGIVIYLKIPSEILLGRLRQDKAERPMVSELSDIEMKEVVNDLLNERKPFYEQADITFGPNKSLRMIKTELNFVIQMSLNQ